MIGKKQMKQSRNLPAATIVHAKLPMELPIRTVGSQITSFIKSKSICHSKKEARFKRPARKHPYAAQIFYKTGKLTSDHVSIVYLNLGGFSEAPSPSRSIA